MFQSTHIRRGNGKDSRGVELVNDAMACTDEGLDGRDDATVASYEVDEVSVSLGVASDG